MPVNQQHCGIEMDFIPECFFIRITVMINGPPLRQPLDFPQADRVVITQHNVVEDLAHQRTNRRPAPPFSRIMATATCGLLYGERRSSVCGHVNARQFCAHYRFVRFQTEDLSGTGFRRNFVRALAKYLCAVPLGRLATPYIRLSPAPSNRNEYRRRAVHAVYPWHLFAVFGGAHQQMRNLQIPSLIRIISALLIWIGVAVRNPDRYQPEWCHPDTTVF